MSLQNLDYETLDELADIFAKKTALLKSSLELRNLDQQSCSKLYPVKNQIADLKLHFQKIRNEIQVLENSLGDMKILLSKIDNIDSRVVCINKNFPVVLDNINKLSQRVDNKPQFQHAPPKVLSQAPSVSKKSQSISKITHLTMDEFNAIPKYMKGRITFHQINDFVDSFNKTIAAKYKLLATPRNEMKNTAYKMVQKMKSQETKDTNGIHFCVGDDLKDLGNIKMDKPSLNMLTILRHFSKTKEIRGPGTLLRYCIQP